MGICPYCEEEIDIEDFYYEMEEVIHGKKKDKVKKVEMFSGQVYELRHNHSLRMYNCPKCKKILGFSEYRWSN